MIDSKGRNIDYLRLSVTKRCFLNCLYCGASNENGVGELTKEEIEKIVRAFASLGIRKVRLTGGEPLIRSDIAEIVESINKIDGIEKIALTTNGVRLKEYAEKLKAAGLKAVNISLDTTDRKEYEIFTGADCLDKVFEGIDEAERVGLSPIRLNAVLIRDKNDGSAESLIYIARNRKIDVRFIELMPFSDEGENENLIVRGEEILERFPFLMPFETGKSTSFEKSVARYYTAEGFKGRVGLITPVSDKFCSDCNRVRVLSDGSVRPCLGSDEVFTLRDVLDDEEKLKERIKEAILSKPDSHRFSCGYGNFHGMNKIGG